MPNTSSWPNFDEKRKRSGMWLLWCRCVLGFWRMFAVSIVCLLFAHLNLITIRFFPSFLSCLFLLHGLAFIYSSTVSLLDHGTINQRHGNQQKNEQLATRSIEPSFGLLFGDILRDLQVGTTGAAVIMGGYDVMMNFSGLFVGPLLKEFSYRKVAIFGALLCSLGLALTSPATNMAHIIATYSVINGEYRF